MKRFTLLATVAALSLSAALPALANGVHVDTSQYTAAEQAFLKTADWQEDRAQINAILNGESSVGITASSKSAPSSGAEQLAHSVGVDAGAYSLADLATLKTANPEESRNLISATLNQATSDTLSDGVTPARAQIAASLGVDASDYTLPELVSMKGD